MYKMCDVCLWMHTANCPLSLIFFLLWCHFLCDSMGITNPTETGSTFHSWMPAELALWNNHCNQASRHWFLCAMGKVGAAGMADIWSHSTESSTVPTQSRAGCWQPAPEDCTVQHSSKSPWVALDLTNPTPGHLLLSFQGEAETRIITTLLSGKDSQLQCSMK